jgi:8-oxo-dGTP pyrophosphatase MutT (NUDIX family)
MIIEDIRAYQPYNEQEQRDKQVILDFIAKNDDAFLRTNLIAHMTASAWVVNEDRTQVLMVYHNIYNSWSWTGGHADGERDLLSVALREVREETGVQHLHPVSENIFSLEVLTVDGHEKHGEYVPSHLHLNVTYLIEADSRDALRVCEAENSGVRWFAPEEALKASTEPWFVTRIYSKLNKKLAEYLNGGKNACNN